MPVTTFTISFDPERFQLDLVEKRSISQDVDTPKSKIGTKISPYGRYIYRNKQNKFNVKIWNGKEFISYGVFTQLDTAVAVRDAAIKNLHPHLIDRLN